MIRIFTRMISFENNAFSTYCYLTGQHKELHYEYTLFFIGDNSLYFKYISVIQQSTPTIYMRENLQNT